MAITAINATFLGQGPVAGGSTILAFGGTSMQELAYMGTAAPVGDGATKDAVINFLDGTNALSFTPTAVLAFRSGGNAANTASVNSTSTINNVAFTVSYATAPGNGLTGTVVFMVFK